MLLLSLVLRTALHLIHIAHHTIDTGHLVRVRDRHVMLVQHLQILHIMIRFHTRQFTLLTAQTARIAASVFRRRRIAMFMRQSIAHTTAVRMLRFLLRHFMRNRHKRMAVFAFTTASTIACTFPVPRRSLNRHKPLHTVTKRARFERILQRTIMIHIIVSVDIDVQQEIFREIVVHSRISHFVLHQGCANTTITCIFHNNIATTNTAVFNVRIRITIGISIHVLTPRSHMR
mmetsp:Transcript_43893/g.72498  ORF Transcript_43893/g.72498 Transcript_43893/m.72498 type:complete len:231 (+) Transcript_43893:358-1050(+)